MNDRLTLDLFACETRPGSLGCAIEVAATIADALDRARAESNISRQQIADRMSHHLGERMSVNMINNYASQSHEHEISLRRAMAFDAALESDVLLNLWAAKRGGRRVISQDDAALLEWARLHHQEKQLAERRRLLEAQIKARTNK